jgi:hypothetical protein
VGDGARAVVRVAAASMRAAARASRRPSARAFSIKFLGARKFSLE